MHITKNSTCWECKQTKEKLVCFDGLEKWKDNAEICLDCLVSAQKSIQADSTVTCEKGEIMLAHCVPEPGKICEKPATFNVWFEKCDGLYGFMCDEHVAKAVVDGVKGYRVYQITAINNNSQYSIPTPSDVRPAPIQHPETL